jgi:DNA-binding YbaB/EbfC family protein
MRGGLGNLMKQAQAMQENLKRAQQQIAALEVEGSAGGGAVKVVVTGTHQVKRVTIDPAVMDDREMLEDLVTSAMNDASAKIEAASSKLMAGVSGGMALPPGMKLPF